MRLKVLAILFFTGISAGAMDGSKHVCYEVEGMTCATCSLTLRTAVKQLDGISSVSASVAKKHAQVDYDPDKTDSKTILNKINSVGYKATEKSCPNKG